MLIRIVKMTFIPEHIPAFLAIFHRSETKIRNFPGCMHLELWQETAHPNVLCTYSHWTDDAALQQYRQSSLFRDTWSQTKVLFAEKPSVFSFLPIISPPAQDRLPTQK